MKRSLAIDFDGTILNPLDIPQGKKMGNPFPDTALVIKELYRHYKIIIHTVRATSPEHVADYLKYYGIPFDEITDKKPNSEWFIDDKAIQFKGDWHDINTFIKANHRS